MSRAYSTVALGLALGLALGCSSAGDAGDAAVPAGDAADGADATDPGTGDASSEDATDASSPRADAGIAGFCPAEPGGSCARASDCAPDDDPASNCTACSPFNRSACVEGECLSPPVLGPGDPYVLAFNVVSTVTPLRSFAGFAVATRTAGGGTIDCASIYSGALDLSSSCLNILDSRGINGIAQQGTSYSITFSQFTAGQETAFVIYGFSDTATRGVRVGVSCTIEQVGAPGGGERRIAADTMRPP